MKNDKMGGMRVGGPSDRPVRPNPIPFLSIGLRPFFLFAGLYGTFSVIIWLIVRQGGLSLPETFTPSLWHGHEMVYGFAMAAATGFLLTAVPNWTQSPPLRGRALGWLALLWLAGRVVIWFSGSLPAALVAGVDLSFIPVFMGVLIPGFIRSAQRRNLVFLAFLLVLFIGNLLIHLDSLGLTGGTALPGLHLGVYGFTVMLALLGGRLTPNFTANALRMQGVDANVRSLPAMEKASYVFMIATTVADLAGAPEPLTGILALVAGIALFVRMRHWQTAKTLKQPILWVLHLGQAWLALGFTIIGVAGLTGLMPESAAIHALTVGAVGTMVLGVMSRAALGHTGHKLVTPKPVVLSYILVSLAAVARIGASLVPTGSAHTMVMVAGILWVTAFGLFSVVYWRILTGPRAR